MDYIVVIPGTNYMKPHARVLDKRIDLVESYPMNHRPFLELFNAVYSLIPFLMENDSWRFFNRAGGSGKVTEDYLVEYYQKGNTIQTKLYDYRSKEDKPVRVYLSGGKLTQKSGIDYILLYPSLCSIVEMSKDSRRAVPIFTNTHW